MVASLTHEAFSQSANSKFQAQGDDNTPVDLELVNVTELKVYSQQEEFTLTFRGPLTPYLGQGVRNFSHDQMGEFELFIVPIRQGAEGFYYEAVFNRIRD